MAPIVVPAGAPAYSPTAHVRTHNPPATSDYGNYRPCIRLEFESRCVYCLAHESEIGPSDNYGAYEIEHFRPKGRHEFRRFRNTYTNLLWACRACNRAKGETWPSTAEQALGYRFIDPTAEGLSAFLTVDGEAVVANPAEPAAQYVVDEINLNSDLHRHRRRRRRELLTRIARMQGILTVMRGRTDDPDQLRDADQLENELRELSSQLGACRPWDLPEACFCRQ